MATKVLQPSLSAGASTQLAYGGALVWKLSQQQALLPPSGQVVSPQRSVGLPLEEELDELDDEVLEDEEVLDALDEEEALAVVVVPPLPPALVVLAPPAPPLPPVPLALVPFVPPGPGLSKRASAPVTPPHPTAVITPALVTKRPIINARFILSLRA